MRTVLLLSIVIAHDKLWYLSWRYWAMRYWVIIKVHLQFIGRSVFYTNGKPRKLIPLGSIYALKTTFTIKNKH